MHRISGGAAHGYLHPSSASMSSCCPGMNQSNKLTMFQSTALARHVASHQATAQRLPNSKPMRYAMRCAYKFIHGQRVKYVTSNAKGSTGLASNRPRWRWWRWGRRRCSRQGAQIDLKDMLLEEGKTRNGTHTSVESQAMYIQLDMVKSTPDMLKLDKLGEYCK